MRNLAQYVLQGRKQAIWVALLFTLLPFLGWVATAIMALVTLRKGPKEGAFVLLWVLLPSVVIALLGYPRVLFYDVIGTMVVTYLLSCILRAYGSWSVVLQFCMIFGIIAVLLTHILLPNFGMEWIHALARSLQQMQKQGVALLDVQRMQNFLQVIAKISLGVQAEFIIIADLLSLLIARWMQAILFNPGGLRRELCNIRLGKLSVVLLLIFVLGSFAGIGVAIDCLPVVFLPFVLAGISLVHSFLITIKNSVFWLFVFYGLLFVFFVYFIFMLLLLALFDSWIDMRKNLKVSPGNNNS